MINYSECTTKSVNRAPNLKTFPQPCVNTTAYQFTVPVEYFNISEKNTKFNDRA